MGNKGSRIGADGSQDEAIIEYQVDGLDEYSGDFGDDLTNYTTSTCEFEREEEEKEMASKMETIKEEESGAQSKPSLFGSFAERDSKRPLDEITINTKKSLREKSLGLCMFIVFGFIATFFAGFLSGRATSSSLANESNSSPEDSFSTQLNPIDIPTPSPIASHALKVNATPTSLKVTTEASGNPSFIFSSNTITVYNILKQYADVEKAATDASTPQGKAFQDLVAAQGTDPVISSFQMLQRFALRTLYYATGGEAWEYVAGWDAFESTNECDLFGMENCDPTESVLKVVKIDLSNNDLRGTIPKEICLLSDTLERLYLSQNDIAGPIPSCFSDFTSMRRLDLHGNKLSGILPEGFMFLPNLRSADFSDNKLTGNLDVTFDGRDGNISPASNLKEFHVNSNQLTGTIPTVFRTLPNLEATSFWGNNFNEDEFDV
mmetsp:Transcript_8349/g.12859  ORF Transcript_8349/g.12859 Transcript_8349/m.12859 type:complete len:434 (-) Transcript_8349:99-1400(-)|eukprot:CAMPEP_0178915460 /NCGR_PEP_ID=MMETSP0786-20121207/12039_1 /TAXON_ID=186022 /ORGANISM="Thalassionema frauenfeldii, Strain CCMP 1798" /LENGTH=433 /DNA_ID=CAMNT_0020588573 /DNA_START=258 /DNA_END=1559 /DNA_ORIENTATION=-